MKKQLPITYLYIMGVAQIYDHVRFKDIFSLIKLTINSAIVIPNSCFDIILLNCFSTRINYIIKNVFGFNGSGISSSPSNCLILISMFRAMAVTGVSLCRLRKGSWRLYAVLSARKNKAAIRTNSGISKIGLTSCMAIDKVIKKDISHREGKAGK